MKPYLLFILFLNPSVFCAELIREVIATSSHEFNHSGLSLSWTLGEVLSYSHTGDKQNLTEGFQQPLELNVSEIGPNLGPVNIKVFPNPTAAILNVYLGNKYEMKLELYNTRGEIVKEIDKFPQANYGEIDLTQFSNGTYFLKVFSSGKVLKRTFKVIKKN